MYDAQGFQNLGVSSSIAGTIVMKRSELAEGLKFYPGNLLGPKKKKKKRLTLLVINEFKTH